MNPLLLHLPLEWINKKAKSLQFTIWEVELSIFLFLKSTTVSLKSKPQTEIPHVVVMMLIPSFKTGLFKNLKLNQELIFKKIKWLFKEFVKLLKKPKLNCLQPCRLKLTYHILQLMPQVPNIAISN